MADQISTKEADVLAHASSNGRYVTNDPFVLSMAERGLLRDFGPQVLAGGAHYLETTPAGRAALGAWRAAQPRPKVKRRRRSEQFDSWMTYCEVWKKVSFSEFLKVIWPERRRYV